MTTQMKPRTRNRTLLSSAVAIHAAALVVAIITNNPVESVARTSNIPVIQPQSAKPEAAPEAAPETANEESVLETSYSGSDYDDWIDELSPSAATDEPRTDFDKGMNEFNSSMSEPNPSMSKLDPPMSEPPSDPVETGIDSESFDSESPFTTAN